jgi:AcrR family transcriptional regulator
VVRHAERADARANRSRLIEAAQAVFRAGGVDAEMREIAERAGIGIGTIYRNYPRKDDLILALLDDALTDASAGANAAEAIADPLDGVRALLSHSYAMAERYGWLVEAHLTGRLRAPLREALVQRSREYDLSGRFHRLLQRAVDHGRLKSDLDIDVAVALLTGSTAQWIVRPLLAERSQEQLAGQVMQLLSNGMRD